MPRVIALVLCLFLSPAICPAQQSSVAPLPVKRVVLYKAGIGYFEHVGEVTGNDQVTISFTSSQLDDALKSLSAVDLGDGRVTSIRYNSVAPVSDRLRNLRLPIGEATSLQEVLAALRGARLSVRPPGGLAVSGRLVSLDRLTRVRGEHEEAYTVLVLAGDGGELRSFELTPALAITIGEADLRNELEEYLRIIGSSRERDVRRMTVSTDGKGRRQLFVSYISEVPVWKVNYRLLLDSKGMRKPLLQGWAIVDNTVGEDWNGVELSLIAGAPQSFVQRVSQPLYSRRPVVPLPSSVLLSPQTHQGAMREGATGVRGRVMDGHGAVLPGVLVALLNDRGQQVRTTVTGASGEYAFSPLDEGTYQLRLSLPGFATRTMMASVSAGAETVQDAQMSAGGLSERVSVAAEGTAQRAAAAPRAARSGGIPGGVAGGVVGGLPEAPPPPPPYEVADAVANVQSAADAQQLGDVFEYRIKEPITVRRNEAALVPIARAETDVEKVSLWSARDGRVVRALWLTNGSGLTLDGGTFSVVEDGAFAGEGLMETLKPGEKRLLSYAADPGVRVEAKQDSQPARIFRARAQHGVLAVQRESRAIRTYTVRNENDAARSVVIEHPTRPGWRLTSSAKVVETAVGAARIRLDVEPHTSAVLTVTEVHPEETSYSVNQLDDDFVRVLVQGGVPAEQVERALKPLLANRAEMHRVAAEIRQRENEIGSIERDQQRLRENMRALTASKADRGLVERYSRQMNAQEDRIEALRRDIKQLQERIQALDADGLRLIDAISLEAPTGA